jgi:hypothetical protein
MRKSHDTNTNRSVKSLIKIPCHTKWIHMRAGGGGKNALRLNLRHCPKINPLFNINRLNLRHNPESEPLFNINDKYANEA